MLRVLEHDGPPYELSPSRLSTVLLRSTGGMTQMLDRLERDGLTARSSDPTDRRKVVVRLTAEGLDLARRSSKEYCARKAALVADLASDELVGIGAALDALRALLDDRRRDG